MFHVPSPSGALRISVDSHVTSWLNMTVTVLAMTYSIKKPAELSGVSIAPLQSIGTPEIRRFIAERQREHRR